MFKETIQAGYTHKGESIVLGAAMLNGVADKDCLIKLPLKTFNRHGLIAGATGTGKTKTLQLIAELLSEKSVPVLVMELRLLEWQMIELMPATNKLVFLSIHIIHL
jgi:uncharacterized protein